MFTKSKYIVGIIGGYRAAVVFSENIQHTVVAQVFQPGSITGAGFCHYEADDVKVYGESIGLGIKADDDDLIYVGRALSHPNYII